MPRVVVYDDAGRARAKVYMDEHVQPGLLDDQHYSVQFLERLAWALWDAVPEGDRTLEALRTRAHQGSLSVLRP